MMKRMHKHNWNLIDKTVVESPYSLALKMGGAMPISATGHSATLYFTERVVLTFKCDCGKVRIEER